MRVPPRFAARHPIRALARLARTRESAMAHRLLDGREGLEIAATAHNPFGVRALNVDRSAAPDTLRKRHEWEMCGRARRVDVVAPFDELPYDEGAVDFVLAARVLQTLPDPIGALAEWMRVARLLVYLELPHRDRMFDPRRELTPVDELVARHGIGLRSDVDQHWSAWTCESFLELCGRLELRVVETADPDDRRGDGFAVAIDAAQAPRAAGG